MKPMNTREEWFNRARVLWRRVQRLISLWWLEAQRFLRGVPWGRVRPGWYVMGALVLYSIFASLQWRGAVAELEGTQAKLEVFEKAAVLENAKLSLPLVGARLPTSVDNLPNAPRVYRRGVSQGFVFTGVDAGVQVQFGMPVLAVADAKVKLLTSNFKELTPKEFQVLLTKVKDGASQNDLNLLRGRQVSLLHKNGVVTRYGHLSSINPNLTYATEIKRGDVIGFVGNSGTLDGTRGTKNNARLLFEIWLENETKFFGAGLSSDTVRREVLKLIKVP
jgi:peptidoglycan LD-endopeptidase LytH